MVAKKTFTFAIDDDLKAGLTLVRERDGVSEAEQIRRAIRAWLESKDAIKTERKRPAAASAPKHTSAHIRRRA